MTIELPDLPARLPDLADEDTITLPVGTTLVRWHDLEGRHPRTHDEPRWYGPLVGKGRFDHHPAGPSTNHEPRHGVLYVALDAPEDAPGDGPVSGHVLDVICAEAVQDGLELLVSSGATLTVFATSGELELLDLRGAWSQCTRAGMRLSTAPHHRTQPWARAIRFAYPHLHGVLYVPSTGGRAVAAALNESAVDFLDGEVVLTRRILDDEMLLIVSAVAARLGFSITRIAIRPPFGTGGSCVSRSG